MIVEKEQKGEWNTDEGILSESPSVKRMASLNTKLSQQVEVVELYDLGDDYLKGFMSSLVTSTRIQTEKKMQELFVLKHMTVCTRCI